MLFDSRTPEYKAATEPHNNLVAQTPARVAVVSSSSDVSEALAESAAPTATTGRPAELVIQATGHGAGAPVGDDTVLVDTSRLARIEIDPGARVAYVGAGATWGSVNAAAERHGLLGPAGSAPSVSVSGYTFAGGIGWLARKAGLASGALRSVDFVDGEGRLRTASDDAADPADRDAIWAFRGAGGVGIATRLEIELTAAPRLTAGTLLWPADALPDVVGAWAASLDRLGPSVASSIAVLHVPPAPPFPDALRGKVAVYLALADPDGPEGAADLLAAVRAAAAPVSDTWGPADAARLGQIHLDPPAATPSIGDARWLDGSTPGIAAELLASAAAEDAPIVMMEIRHVADAPVRRPGALTAPPSPFIFHAVGTPERATHESIETGFAAAREIWRSADSGLNPGSWLEGSAVAPDALPPAVLARARSIADAVDPGHRIRRSRLLG